MYDFDRKSEGQSFWFYHWHCVEDEREVWGPFSHRPTPSWHFLGSSRTRCPPTTSSTESARRRMRPCSGSGNPQNKGNWHVWSVLIDSFKAQRFNTSGTNRRNINYWFWPKHALRKFKSPGVWAHDCILFIWQPAVLSNSITQNTFCLHSNKFICTRPDPGQGKWLPCICLWFLERSENHGRFLYLILLGLA